MQLHKIKTVDFLLPLAFPPIYPLCAKRPNVFLCKSFETTTWIHAKKGKKKELG